MAKRKPKVAVEPEKPAKESAGSAKESKDTKKEPAAKSDREVPIRPGSMGRRI